MAQLAYSSITITDTNDIERITIEYARNQSTSEAPTSGWGTSRPAWAQGYYIWQRTRIHKSGTQDSEDTFGTAVCLTGSTGQTGATGRSLTGTITKYTSVASNTTQAQVEALAESNWGSNVPNYTSSKPDYWVRITNTYNSAPLTENIYYKDNGLTDAIAKANDAWNKAAQAQSDAENALSQVQVATQITALLGGHFIYNSEWTTANTPHSANVVQTILKNGVDVTQDPTKWDYNVHIGSNGIRLRDNELVLSEWTEKALSFYTPTQSNNTPVQGGRGMMLNTNGFTVFQPNAFMLSTDTTVDNTKIYYINNNSMYTEVINPSGNPSAKSYYELKRGITLDSNNLSLYNPSTNQVGINLTSTGMILYKPNTTVASISLTANALTFYNPSTSEPSMALNSEGIVLYVPSGINKGSKAITLDAENIKLYKLDKGYNVPLLLLNGGNIEFLNLNGVAQARFGADGAYLHNFNADAGQIGNTNLYWAINTNFTDANSRNYISLMGYDGATGTATGNSFIQPSNTGYWRIARNRIHNGWFNPSGNNPSFFKYLSYSESNVSKYWDWGLKTPISLADKFIYIRKSTNSNVFTQAADVDTNWVFPFFVTGSGNIYARNFYTVKEDGTISATPIAGDEGIFLEKSGGTMTGNITMDNGAKLIGGVEGNVTGNLTGKATTAGTADQVGHNLIIRWGAGQTEGDNKWTYNGSATKDLTITKSSIGLGSVENTALSTWAGSSNLTTTKVGTLGTAATKGVDTSITASSTSTNLPTSKAVADLIRGYLPLTGGNVTGAVSFGDSVTIDEATIGDLVVTGNSSFANNLQVNTINGVAVGNNPEFTDTTYTRGTATSGGTTLSLVNTGDMYTWNNKQDKLTNPVTGTGTNGYLAKWSGSSTVTTGPALGTDTTKFLNNKGEWAVPAGTYTYTLPLAANGTRGGVQIGFTTNATNRNYAVQLSSEKMYVNVPWENTTYSAGTGLSLNGTTFNHSNSVTAGTAGTSSATSSTNRTIAIPYVTYDAQGHITSSGTHTHTIDTYPEAYLAWGGRNITGDITPVGMSISTEHSANRIAYLNPAAITIEYTTNGGSSWTDSGYTNDEKMWLCTGSQSIAVGQSRSGYSQSTALTTNHWTRITLTGQNGSAGYVYTDPRKLLINIGSAVGLNCLIEYKTGASGASWQTFGTYAVSGWSGWNDIPLILGTFGGSSTQTSNNWYLRFTFKVTSTRTDSYKGYSTVLGLRLFGTNNWTSASSNNNKGPISSTGHLYSYDASANATFPAKVTANGGFSGNLTGTATGNVTSIQYDSTNTKFTYTKNDTNTDIVTIANLKTYLGLGSLAYKSSLSKSDVGLGNVDNLSAASIRSGISSSNVTNALGYTPSKTISSIGISGSTITITYSDNTTTTGTMTAAVAEVATQATKLTDANGNAITVGGTSQPVYFSSGVPVGISGTSGAALVGKGADQAPEWKALGSAAYSNTSAFATSAQGTKADSAVQSISFAGTALTVSSGAASITQANARTALGLAAAAYKALADSSSASAIGTGSNVTTERDVYYGLPTINNAHNYTSSTTIYAPTAGGTSSQVLIGNGTTSAPVWTDISGLVPSSATNATNATYATYDASEVNNTTKVTIANKFIPKSIGTAAGDIIYWSASGTPTRLAKGSNGQVLKLASGVPTWGTDNNDNYYHTTGSWSGLTYTATANGGAGALAFTLPTASASASGIVNTDAQVLAGKKTIKYTTRIYPIVGASNEKSQWYKITFPYYNAETTSAAKWFMNSFDLHFGGGYNSNATGVAHVTFYWTRATNNGAWSASQVSAKMDGILMNKITLYYRIAEPGILYVNNSSNNYNGVWLDNLYVDDTSPSLDWSTTTIETCSAITVANYTEIPTVRTYNNNNTNYIIGNHTLPMTNNTYNLGSSDYKWANIYATTFTGTLSGNASTASKITDLTSTDNASSSATWRKVWISYADGVTGRPAVTDGLTFQTSTNTLKATTFSGALSGNASTATKWASAQTVYVALGTASTTTTIQGGSSSAQTIGVNGTLAISNGGTGLTASPSMLTNLGSTTAANVLQASPRPGITGTLGAANGGTGQTSLINAANSLLNALSTGSSTPVDNDYYISQYVGGGTTTTTYHRRPMSALWSYISGKISSSGTYVTIGTNQTITASQKTFNGAIRWSVSGSATGSKYGACQYDSTLDALVFSFGTI